MDDGEALDNVLSSRRIPHGRSRNKQGGGKGKGRSKGGRAATFDPLRALGHYQIQLGSSNNRAQQHKTDPALSSGWLEIHELTEGEDGLIGTFSFNDDSNRLSGMCVLTGSRKTLQSIVEDLDEVDDDENEVNSRDAGDEIDEESDDEDEPEPKTELELADEKLNRRFRAFEKNSFRNPKFWMRWKGHAQGSTPTIHTAESQTQTPTSTSTATESDLGYVVFTSNDCDKFDGTITCVSLGWDNLKMQGRKTKTKGTPCPMNWRDV